MGEAGVLGLTDETLDLFMVHASLESEYHLGGRVFQAARKAVLQPLLADLHKGYGWLALHPIIHPSGPIPDSTER